MHTTTTALFTTKPKTATWKGRPGVTTTIARTATAARQCGERVSIIRWADTGEVTVRHLTGNGRTSALVEVAGISGDLTDAQVAAWADTHLTVETD